MPEGGANQPEDLSGQILHLRIAAHADTGGQLRQVEQTVFFVVEGGTCPKALQSCILRKTQHLLRPVETSSGQQSAGGEKDGSFLLPQRPVQEVRDFPAGGAEGGVVFLIPVNVQDFLPVRVGKGPEKLPCFFQPVPKNMGNGAPVECVAEYLEDLTKDAFPFGREVKCRPFRVLIRQR